MLSFRSFSRVLATTTNRKVLTASFHGSAMVQAKVAVVLSGAGVYDGSELHEASACLVHLSREGATVAMFAPDVDQMHVINHLKGAPVDGEKRNVLVESARIARGKIDPLSQLKQDNFDAVVFPGGFGAAKNLSSFAVDGEKCSVFQDVKRVIQDFHQAKKPIGLCCIAPVLAARVLGGAGVKVEVTVGSDQEEGGRYPYAGTAGAVQSMGAKHVKKDVTETHVDTTNRIVTTPAYMCETAVHEVHDGVGVMVRDVLKMTK